ncbi:hypothetical protein AB0M45_21720 [Nocardia sp. NPDC051787]|uniref:hypothetical protein n=1 Tax=Nocardia sp. NPDC051787 TaxID=3155415 RepID=UPI0034322D30
MHYDRGVFDSLDSDLAKVVGSNEANTERFLNAAKTVAYDAWADTDMAEKFFAKAMEMVKRFEHMKDQVVNYQTAASTTCENAFETQRHIVSRWC